MKYIQWRDELEGYLRDLPDEEKQKVFAYFAEMYADKRDAGMSERSICDEFGAPYDVAQRILHENSEADDGEDGYESVPPPVRRRERNGRKSGRAALDEDKDDGGGRNRSSSASREKVADADRKSDHTWLFVILCVVFCIPLFVVLVVLISLSVGFFVAPLSVIVGGFATAGGAIGGLVSGSGTAAIGVISLGMGLVAAGIGLILLPVFVKIIRLMWRLFKAVFNAIKCLFRGKKERA